MKTCHHNASWERRDGREWTNYQPCLKVDVRLVYSFKVISVYYDCKM